MKKLFAVTLIGLSGSLSAAELDLQPGQWSVDLLPTSLSVFSNNNTTENAGAEQISKDHDGGFSFSTDIRHAIDTKVQVGSYVKYWTSNVSTRATTAGVVTADAREKDSGTSLNPYLYYAVTPEVSLYGELGFYTSPAAILTDSAGNKFYSSYERKEYGVFVGAVYKKDLKPNIMLEVLGAVGMNSYKNTDPANSSDTYEWIYLRNVVAATGKYFLADNFSANGTAGLFIGRKTSERNDGVEVSIDNDQFSYSNVSVKAGFTYYFR